MFLVKKGKGWMKTSVLSRCIHEVTWSFEDATVGWQHLSFKEEKRLKRDSRLFNETKLVSRDVASEDISV